MRLAECRVAYFAMDGGEYQRLLQDDCSQRAARGGLEIRDFQPSGDPMKQVGQIQACLREPAERRPNLIIVSPVREIALLAVANAAARLGIGWVMLCRWCQYLDELREEFPKVPIFSVLADQVELGRIQGRQVRELLPRDAAILYVRGPLGTSSAMGRTAGLQEALQGLPNRVYIVNGDWTARSGARALRDWLRQFRRREMPRFVVAAQNDAMAMGAKGAWEEVAVERPNLASAALAFCGSDGSPGYGQRLASEGVLASTVITPVGGARAITEATAMWETGVRPDARIVLAPIGFPGPRLAQALGA
jgi:ribose transport system substrate-binding protein